MEYRALNMTVISAEGIKDVKHFSKMDVYAEVSIRGYPQSKKQTLVDKDSGTRPKWNHRIEMMVDEPYLTKPGLVLLFNLKAQSTFGSDKDIGSVTVPINELFQANPTEDRVVEYQVITTSGRPKGSLKFSYRFGEKFAQETKKHADEPVTAYPAPPAPQYTAGGSYPLSSGYGYQAPPPPLGYGYGYPNHPPPPQQGYGYQGPPPPGYAGYAQPQKPKRNKMGMGSGLGMGLGAGLLGGLLVGDMASDAGAYADGYDDAMGDMGGFDF